MIVLDTNVVSKAMKRLVLAPPDTSAFDAAGVEVIDAWKAEP